MTIVAGRWIAARERLREVATYLRRQIVAASQAKRHEVRWRTKMLVTACESEALEPLMKAHATVMAQLRAMNTWHNFLT